MYTYMVWRPPISCVNSTHTGEFKTYRQRHPRCKTTRKPRNALIHSKTFALIAKYQYHHHDAKLRLRYTQKHSREI